MDINLASACAPIILLIGLSPFPSQNLCLHVLLPGILSPHFFAWPAPPCLSLSPHVTSSERTSLAFLASPIKIAYSPYPHQSLSTPLLHSCFSTQHLGRSENYFSLYLLMHLPPMCFHTNVSSMKADEANLVFHGLSSAWHTGSYSKRVSNECINE